MCMSTVTSTIEKPHKSGVGWKVFRLSKNGRLLPEYNGKGAYALGEWYETYDLSCHSFKYTKGFHVFLLRRSAERWSGKVLRGGRIVRKVKWQHELAQGFQENLRIVVVKEIMIPRTPKERCAHAQLPH